MHVSTVALTSVFLSLAHGAALQSRAFSGEATFYGGNLHGGTCSFSTYTLPSGIYGTALSDLNWVDAGNCGACVSVTGPAGNSITAMIVDQCPGCGLNHLDLFPDAFAALANPTTGVIQTTWSFVDCPITTPLELHNKDGVSQYWFSMQVTNANKAVTTLEVSTDGGSTWTGTERQSYNFFQYSSGFGTATVDVRVTSVEGDVVVVNNVEVASGASTTASSNFGSAAAAAAAVVAPAASSSATPTQTATADVSTDPPPMATPTQAITPSETTEAAGIFEPTLSTADYPLPTTTSTPSEAMAPTTFVTVYAPCTTSSAAVTTVTVYSYESCTA